MNGCEVLLNYLRDKIPGYSFEEERDRLFVNELLEDFPEIDHLEELKKFRLWVFDTGVSKGYRMILRKWFLRSGKWGGRKNERTVVGRNKKTLFCGEDE